MEPTASLDNPTRAFDDLRREVSLGLRAIQGLAAEHNDQLDYSDTLKAIDEKLAKTDETLTAIVDSPAMCLTPASLTQAIVRASVEARERDAEMLRNAASASNDHVRQLRLAIDRVRSSAEQKTKVRWALAIGLMAGIALWSILPGAFMRSLPMTWHAPEWMAMRVMRTDYINGASRLIQIVPQGDQPAQAGLLPNKPAPESGGVSIPRRSSTKRSRN